METGNQNLELIIFIFDGQEVSIDIKYLEESGLIQEIKVQQQIQQQQQPNKTPVKSITVTLPKWVSVQIFNIFHDYITNKNLSQWADKTLTLCDQTLQRLLWLGDYFQLEQFQGKCITDILIPRIKTKNCLLFLNEAFKKLKACQDSCDIWYMLLNTGMNYTAKNIISIYQSAPEELIKINSKILQEIIERSLKYFKKQSSVQYQDMVDVILHIRSITDVFQLLSNQRQNIINKKINYSNHPSISWKLSNINSIINQQTNPFKFNDYQWKLVAKMQDHEVINSLGQRVPSDQKSLLIYLRLENNGTNNISQSGATGSSISTQSMGKDDNGSASYDEVQMNNNFGKKQEIGSSFATDRLLSLNGAAAGKIGGSTNIDESTGMNGPGGPLNAQANDHQKIIAIYFLLKLNDKEYSTNFNIRHIVIDQSPQVLLCEFGANELQSFENKKLEFTVYLNTDYIYSLLLNYLANNWQLHGQSQNIKLMDFEDIVAIIKSLPNLPTYQQGALMLLSQFINQNVANEFPLQPFKHIDYKNVSLGVLQKVLENRKIQTLNEIRTHLETERNNQMAKEGDSNLNSKFMSPSLNLLRPPTPPPVKHSAPIGLNQQGIVQHAPQLTGIGHLFGNPGTGSDDTRSEYNSLKDVHNDSIISTFSNSQLIAGNSMSSVFKDDLMSAIRPTSSGFNDQKDIFSKMNFLSPNLNSHNTSALSQQNSHTLPFPAPSSTSSSSSSNINQNTNKSFSSTQKRGSTEESATDFRRKPHFEPLNTLQPPQSTINNSSNSHINNNNVSINMPAHPSAYEKFNDSRSLDPSFDRSMKSFDKSEGFKKKMTDSQYGQIAPGNSSSAFPPKVLQDMPMNKLDKLRKTPSVSKISGNSSSNNKQGALGSNVNTSATYALGSPYYEDASGRKQYKPSMEQQHNPSVSNINLNPLVSPANSNKPPPNNGYFNMNMNPITSSINPNNINNGSNQKLPTNENRRSRYEQTQYQQPGQQSTGLQLPQQQSGIESGTHSTIFNQNLPSASPSQIQSTTASQINPIHNAPNNNNYYNQQQYNHPQHQQQQQLNMYGAQPPVQSMPNQFNIHNNQQQQQQQPQQPMSQQQYRKRQILAEIDIRKFINPNEAWLINEFNDLYV